MASPSNAAPTSYRHNKASVAAYSPQIVHITEAEVAKAVAALQASVPLLEAESPESAAVSVPFSQRGIRCKARLTALARNSWTWTGSGQNHRALSGVGIVQHGECRQCRCG